MLNMKKVLITGTVLTALCASAFAATNDQAEKPTMRERVNCILAENCDNAPQYHGRHHKRPPMSPEQRAEMEKRRAEWEKMTPDQRQEAREKWQKERQKRYEKRAEEAMSKLTPEQKAEVEAFIKEDLAQRQARREKLANMIPEQRQAIRTNLPLHHENDKHFRGHRGYGQFRGQGPMYNHRPDCPVAPTNVPGPCPDCPAAPIK